MRAVAVGACILATTAIAPASLPAAAATVRVRVFHFVDRSRTIRPRELETVVRYPARRGRYPLIVFAHGFALTPGQYAALLNAWSEAGYVVAAPVFPHTNTNARGGPTEADLVNQPGDMSFVITRLLELDREPTSALSHEIDPARIAVAGHSDGGITALATAYDSRYRDRRVRAAIVLSGAPLGGMGAFPRNGPPLLAVQGAADPINAAATTVSYFRLAARPKFLLLLLGASHLPPYTDQEPQLTIVERTTVAFLDHYLKRAPLGPLERAAYRRGLTRLVADP
jgi:dienelactone hydrolase